MLTYIVLHRPAHSEDKGDSQRRLKEMLPAAPPTAAPPTAAQLPAAVDIEQSSATPSMHNPYTIQSHVHMQSDSRKRISCIYLKESANVLSRDMCTPRKLHAESYS
jgi:hypothetical protein